MRYAREKDLPDLIQLEKSCCLPGLRKSATVLRKRLKQYPEGQLVLEIEGSVVGSIYFSRIDDVDDVKNSSVNSVENLHTTDGSIIHLLAVNILPEMQQRVLGSQLLEFMLQCDAA